MSRIDNHIYYLLCSKLIKMRRGTNFSSFSDYCYWFRVNFLHDSMASHNFLASVTELSRHLQVIFGLELEETIGYIRKFFLEYIFKRIGPNAIALEEVLPSF